MDDDVDYAFVFEMGDDIVVVCEDVYVATMMTVMAEQNIDGCVG